jgi:hypothetical protein
MALKLLGRRAVLQGAGITLALPFFESLTRKGLAAPPPGLKFVAFYFGNGVLEKNNYWFPSGTETSWNLTPALQPLAAHKNDLTIIEGLVNTGLIRGDKDSPQYAHQNEIGGFLTGESYEANPNSKYEAKPTLKNKATSLDQLFADLTGSPIKSLVLSACKQTQATSYAHMSYRGGVLVPRIDSSKALFERLFVFDGTAPKQGTSDVDRFIRENVVNHVLDDVRSLKARVLGAEDKAKLDEYLTSLQEVQQSVAMEGSQQARCRLPARGPFDSDADPQNGSLIGMRSKNMMDLLTLALQCGLTRTVSFVLTQASGMSPEHKHLDGAPDANAPNMTLHWASHWRGGLHPDAERTFRSFLVWEMKKLAYLLDKLKAASDAGGGRLFDNTLVLAGSGLGDGDSHRRKNSATIITGRAGGRVQLGRFKKLPCDASKHTSFLPGETPRENMLAGLAKVLGVNTTFPGATGMLDL